MTRKSRKTLAGLLGVLVLAALTAGCNKPSQPAGGSAKAPSKPEEFVGTLTAWDWSGEDQNTPDGAYQSFKKLYKNVNFQVVPVATGEYVQKLQISLASGMDLPSVIHGERGFRGKLFAMDILENLEAAPYNFDKSQVLDYALPEITSPYGVIVAVPMDVSTGGLAYNKHLAKEYLGTDGPKELQALLPSWDKFIELGKTVAQKSNGQILMFASLGDLDIILRGQQPSPVVTGNTVNLEPLRQRYDLMLRMRNAGIVDKLDQWSPAWNASYTTDKHIFYPCAAWSPLYVIAPNDKDGKDRWGLMVPPAGGFVWGGTTISIPRNGKDKALAWEFVKWNSLSEAGAKFYKDKYGQWMPYKKLYQDPEYMKLLVPQFGAQDLGDTFFNAIQPTVKSYPVTMYDSVVDEVDSLVVSTMNKGTRMEAADALKLFSDEIVKKEPSILLK